ncbi:hypothetical protein Cadr_000019007 [Camelus dromedarius]|uniref:Uncharacterized protein n=1 Tax=Camelus dromedarius TaxID=9838 RepID=A0A5N4D2W0_CAMDR|nr:hypothetical protein Cadr_000019007 [Camelus dromedarius]
MDHLLCAAGYRPQHPHVSWPGAQGHGFTWSKPGHKPWQAGGGR